VTTYYGTDNPIDGVILDVLIRKHKRIKSDLGVTVAVPGSSEQIAEALFEGALFREKTHAHPDQLRLDFIDEMETKKKDLHVQWDNARDREKASRSRFAQHAINPEEVAQELASVRAAIGRSEDVSRFFSDVLQLTGVPFDQKANAVRVHVSSETPRALRQAIGFDDPFAGRFELPLGEKEIYLARTSPVIEGLANWVLDQALDPVARDGRPIAARLGVISTSAVHERTTLFVIRFRYHLEKAGTDEAILCEEVVPLACTGPQDNPTWLPQDESEKLLSARPERNLIATAINQQTGLLQELLPAFRQSLEIVAKERADIQLAAHERVRAALKTKTRMAIKPVLPADILGAYVVLPRLI
jgi:hypothetical protein